MRLEESEDIISSYHHIILYTLSSVGSVSLKFFLKVQKSRKKKIWSANAGRCQKRLDRNFKSKQTLVGENSTVCMMPFRVDLLTFTTLQEYTAINTENIYGSLLKANADFQIAYGIEDILVQI